MPTPDKKSPVTFVDFRDITRESKKTATRVCLVDKYGREEIPWLVLGESHLRAPERTNGSDVWRFTARMVDGATDFEHDSAYSMSIPLIGVEIESVEYGVSTFRARIALEDFDDFRVPNPGYDPTKLEGAHKCENCKPSHWIVPEGFFGGPPKNLELYKAVRGKRITIQTGHAGFLKHYERR